VSDVIGITEISAVVAATGVLVRVVYYLFDLRFQTKLRKTDLFVREEKRTEASVKSLGRWCLLEV
jgi:hypothetical protein